MRLGTVVVAPILGLLLMLGSHCSSSPASAPDATTVLIPKQCPEGLAGPKLVLLTSPNGVSYCIDSTEVTVQQYFDFAHAAEGNVSYRNPRCDYPNQKTTYIPDTSDLGNCVGGRFADPSAPMVCVDWCDATAFCNWAGKRLCGKIGGGGYLMAPTGNGNVDLSLGTDPLTSQWYNACSQGGRTDYSYGNIEDDSKCARKQISSPNCHGESEPYDKVFDLSGSVDEWEDFCYPNYGPCVARGSLASAGNDGACDVLGLDAGSSPSIGFRCCLD